MSTWPPIVPARQPGWETRAIATLGRLLSDPFQWGVADCLILPAELCEAMTGVQPMPAAMRNYASAEEANETLSKLGLAGIEGALRAVFPEVAPARARRFDCGIRAVQVGDFTFASTFIIVDGGMAVGKRDGVAKMVVPAASLRPTFAIGAMGGA